MWTGNLQFAGEFARGILLLGSGALATGFETWLKKMLGLIGGWSKLMPFEISAFGFGALRPVILIPCVMRPSNFLGGDRRSED